MTVASFSPEGRLQAGLHKLNCSILSFSRIAGINRTRLMDALAGRDDLENPLAERLLGVLAELNALQAEIDAPLDFSRTREIEIAIVTRRAARIAAELGDNQFAQIADRATNRLKPETFGREK